LVDPALRHGILEFLFTYSLISTFLQVDIGKTASVKGVVTRASSWSSARVTAYQVSITSGTGKLVKQALAATRLHRWGHPAGGDLIGKGFRFKTVW